MQNLMGLIKPKKRFKVLTCTTHERYQSDMSDINADFYMFKSGPHIKSWLKKYAEIPYNHIELPEEYLPIGFDFDFVLSQNRFGQYQVLSEISKMLNIPLICLEHTLPLRQWSPKDFETMKNLRGHINLYISNFSAKKWEEPEPIIIPHCVNTEVFKPGAENRKNHILTVANDYPNRDSVLGFTQYLNVTRGLPTFPVGDSPGFSEAAKDINHLAEIYRTSKIFLNTSTWSPIPKSLLEAMSSGCVVISSNNCEIPKYISHGLNGFLANSDEEMRQYLELALKDEDIVHTMGSNARKTILKKCSKENFTTTWDDIFVKIKNSQLRIKNES
jgi:glycosyltransferase involved in cell wall biosynthesis